MATSDQSTIPKNVEPTKPFIIISLSHIIKLTPTNYLKLPILAMIFINSLMDLILLLLKPLPVAIPPHLIPRTPHGFVRTS